METVQMFVTSAYKSLSNFIALLMIHICQFKENVRVLSIRFQTNGFLPELENMYQQIEPSLPPSVVACKKFCCDKLGKVAPHCRYAIQLFKDRVDLLVVSLQSNPIFQQLERILQQVKQIFSQWVVFFKERCVGKLNQVKLQYFSALTFFSENFDSILALLRVEQLRAFVTQQLSFVNHAEDQMGDHGGENIAKEVD